MSLSNSNVVVALFVMEGCFACAEFLPRFQQIAAPYQKAGVPVMIIDAGSEDKEINGLADRWGVFATPTTVVARRGPGMIKREGILSEPDLQQLFAAAQHCQMTGQL